MSTVEVIDGPLKYYGSWDQNEAYQVHKFKKEYSGYITFEFDLKLNALSDGVIAFSNQSKVYGPEAIAIQTKGPFISRNGDGKGNASNEEFYTPTVGETYHFTVTTNTLEHLWSAVMKTPDGKTVTVADNYGYRTNQDGIDRILLNRNTSTSNYVDDVELTNLEIKVVGGGEEPEIPENPEIPEGLKYEAYDGYVEITDYTGDAEKLVIPAEIEGKPVTSIGDYAFEYCDSLTSVSIPDGVTSIGEGAFAYCEGIKRVVIPSGVPSINDRTFLYCTGLISIEIPESVTKISCC